MAKKPRQAHIPQQVRRRRPVRRTASGTTFLDEEPVFADTPAMDILPALGAQLPVDTRPGRRLQAIRQTQETVSLRNIPGQLPTFERAYLIDELKRIAMISSALLAVIIALTVILR